MKITSRIAYSTVAVVASSALMAVTAFAGHSWGNYHWGRTANPLPLELGDNVTSTWDGSLALAATDWNVSGVLDTNIVSGKTKPRNCRPTNGRAEICNSKYGGTGWLGIAQIWVSGDHIAQGVVKLNDTYFNTASYNTPEWRNFVTCQEVGHIFGLGHQDEDFNNAPLGTCMDYTSDPTPNQHPNTHDYEQLEAMYGHLDGSNTYILSDGDDGGGGGNGKGRGGGKKGKPANVGQDIDLNNPSEWGKQVSAHVYERNLGNGNKLITDVFWIQ